MRIRTIGLLAATATLAAACGAAPGSTEWCKDVMSGKIQPSQAEAQAHGQKCAQELMKEMLGGLGAMSGTGQ